MANLLIGAIDGTSTYNFTRLARSESNNQALTHGQFMERFTFGADAPDETIGVQYGFYFETTNNLFYYRIGTEWFQTGAQLEVLNQGDDSDPSRLITFRLTLQVLE